MTNNVTLQRNIAFLAIILFIFKVIAWKLTKSVAIFTDALESTVNVATGLIGWYSLWLSAKPKDHNHPYGHSKVEFISAAIEGTLISIAGLIIIYESVIHLKNPQPIQSFDYGIMLIGITAILNFVTGRYAIKKGKEKRSIALEASGKHLCTDTYSTLGIIVGLLLIKLTGWLWLDPLIAMIFAIIILITGYRVLRKSLAGIMDEADIELIDELIAFVNEHRKPEWIDLHNLRIIKYGDMLHMDAHLTMPWYYTVRSAHEEIEILSKLIAQKFGGSVELFIHTDDCIPSSCTICSLENCQVRQFPQEKKLIWNEQNVMSNKKHQL